MNLRRTVVLLLLALSPFVALHAQTTEALPLSSDVIEGGPGTAEDIYFAFSAGPGDVVAIAESVFAADASDATLEVELLSFGEEGVLTKLAGEVLDRGRQRLEEALRRGVADLLPEAAAQAPVRRRTRVRAQLPDAQTVILRIRAGSGISRFKVKLEGPIELADANDIATPVEDGSTVPVVVEEWTAPADDGSGVPSPNDEAATEEVAFTDEEQWNAGDDATAEEPPPAGEEPVSVAEEVPPPTTEARPPIRIPGPATTQAKPPIRIPGPATTQAKPPIRIPGPATTQAKPPILIPVRKAPPIVIPGKSVSVGSKATPRPPIRITSVKKTPIVVTPKTTGSGTTTPKITKPAPSKPVSASTGTAKAPVKVKIPSPKKPQGSAQ